MQVHKSGHVAYDYISKKMKASWVMKLWQYICGGVIVG